jgi:hypothetical protein
VFSIRDVLDVGLERTEGAYGLQKKSRDRL